MSRIYVHVDKKIIGRIDNQESAYDSRGRKIGWYSKSNNITYSDLSQVFCEGNGLNMLILQSWNENQIESATNASSSNFSGIFIWGLIILGFFLFGVLKDLYQSIHLPSFNARNIFLSMGVIGIIYYILKVIYKVYKKWSEFNKI